MRISLLKFFLPCAALALSLAFALTLSGCGKKGALYLPETPAALPTAAQPTQPVNK